MSNAFNSFVGGLAGQSTGTINGFSVVGLTGFDASRYAITGTNQIHSVGSLDGLMVGMQVTGDGIPTGTTITAINNDGTIVFSNDISAMSGGFTAALTVRNRLVQAYTDIMNMQV